MVKIFKACEPNWINGLSILGGEPFEPENQKVLLPFLVMFKDKFPTKTIWCYTGFTFEEIKNNDDSRAHTDLSGEMLALIDVLVDGRYVDELNDISLVFRGSSNQRVIDVKKSLEENKIVLHLE
jgi:anaerobic ribonucleoside-triphosphate reductase activating protein